MRLRVLSRSTIFDMEIPCVLGFRTEPSRDHFLISDRRLVSVEKRGNLFKRRPFRLDKQKVNRETFEDKNDNVDEVELPGDLSQSDRIDVLLDRY